MSRPVLNEQAKAAARRAGGGLVQRATRWLAPVYDRYSKNLLTHGADYLRGDDEISIFSAAEGGLQDWRPLPGAGQTSLSHATLTTTESGSMLLQGRYGGPVTAAQLLSGAALSETPTDAVGVGVCGMGTTGRWPWDLAQHHWLELQVRDDGRPYELVLQAETQYQKSQWVWRADIPVGPKPARPAAVGPHALLGVAPGASADEVQRAYKELAMQHHPDRGGSEERFKALAKAYARVSGADPSGGAPEEADEADELGDWRSVKMPFTAFRDYRFHEFSERVAHMYILLRDERPGPFALELGSVKAGRCERAELPAAGLKGSIGCEMGHCECGYYNGLRVQGFEGPHPWPAPGQRLPPGVLERGFAEHHIEDDPRESMDM